MKTYLPHKIVEHLNLQHDGPHVEFMMRLRDSTPYDATIVELGSHAGFFGNLFLTGNRKVYCIDVWDDINRGKDSDGGLFFQNEKSGGWQKVYETCLENCGEDLFRKIFPIRASSKIISKYWSLPIDLIYIDAGHDYENVKFDIINWWNKIKFGGLMTGDDFDPSWGVYKAVNEIFPKRQNPFHGIWLVQKNEQTMQEFNDYIDKNKVNLLSLDLKIQ